MQAMKSALGLRDCGLCRQGVELCLCRLMGAFGLFQRGFGDVVPGMQLLLARQFCRGNRQLCLGGGNLCRAGSQLLFCAACVDFQQ